MGCNVSRAAPKELSKEEKAIFTHEQLLGYDKKHIVNIFKVLDKHAMEGTIENHALVKALKELNIDTSPFDNQNSLVSQFYLFFEVYGKISLSLIKYLAIIISPSVPDIKASLMFDMIDRPHNKADLRAHLEGLSTCAMRLIGLAEGRNIDQLSFEDINNYAYQLSVTQPIFIHHTLDCMMQDRLELTKGEFVDEFIRNPERRKILTSTGIRQLIMEYHNMPDFMHFKIENEEKLQSRMEMSDHKSVSVSYCDVSQSVDFRRNASFISLSSDEEEDSDKAPVMCDEGKRVKHKANLSDKMEKILGSRVLECSVCKQLWEGDAYYCKRCNYFLCDSCYNYLNAPPIKLHCAKGHLLRDCDVIDFYVSQGKPASFKCKRCQMIKTENSYHCRSCLYDLCKACSKRPPGFVCRKNHPLFWKFDQEDKNCKVCGGACKDYFDCEEGHFPICSRCASKNEKRRILHDHRRHRLTWVLERSYPETGYGCDSCRSAKQGGSFHCQPCHYDVCATCVNNFTKA